MIIQYHIVTFSIRNAKQPSIYNRNLFFSQIFCRSIWCAILHPFKIMNIFEIFAGLKSTSNRLQLSNFTVKAVANNSTTDYESVNEQTYPRANSEKNDDSDDHKMIKICDKLIEVFMVDKPTPGDWRRLLAFSKEWDTIRPHFFERCQARANAENDPGMMHKLLRLGRKLKEVFGFI